MPQASDATVAGTTVSELTLAPGLQFDETSYQATTAGLPTRVTSLVFFDLRPLLRLGEQTGLIGSSTLAALQPDLEQIRTIGLASTSGGSDTTTQLQLEIR